MIQAVIIGIIAEPEEKKVPNYIVPTSNFGTGSNDAAYLLGIPCKVMSKPYEKEVDGIYGPKVREVYDVMSMVTGFEYTIPTGWAHEYDTLEEANKHAHVKGVENPNYKNLINRMYWPRDNSWNLDFEGKWHPLVGKECMIVSRPFTEKTYDKYPVGGVDKERTFILVKHNGKVHRVLFEEWCLDKPEV